MPPQSVGAYHHGSAANRPLKGPRDPVNLGRLLIRAVLFTRRVVMNPSGELRRVWWANAVNLASLSRRTVMEKQRPPERGGDDGLLSHGKFTLVRYWWSSGKRSRLFVSRLTRLDVGKKESWTVAETNALMDVSVLRLSSKDVLPKRG